MKIKIILTISIALLFVITTIMAIYSAGGLINLGIKQVIEYDECDYGPRAPKMVDENGTAMVSEEIVDPWCYNSNKRELAQNLSMLLVSLPLAILFYLQVRKMLKE